MLLLSFQFCELLIPITLVESRLKCDEFTYNTPVFDRCMLPRSNQQHTHTHTTKSKKKGDLQFDKLYSHFGWRKQQVNEREKSKKVNLECWETGGQVKILPLETPVKR